MTDIPLRGQVKVESALQVIMKEGHLNGMMDASDWMQLMCCNSRTKQAIERGLVNGCLSVQELALAMAPNNQQPILLPIAASFPNIKSVVIRGETYVLGALRLPIWSFTQRMARRRLSWFWQMISGCAPWRRNPTPVPRMNTLSSLVAENITMGTFISIETSLGQQFANCNVAFPSLHTLKISVHSGECDMSYQWQTNRHVQPESLSRHMPQLLCLQWPHYLIPTDVSAILELSARCQSCQPVWNSLAKHAFSLTRLAMDLYLHSHIFNGLRIESFPPLIQEIDLHNLSVTIGAPLPSTLVSFKCDVLSTTNGSYLTAKHLPSSLTLLHVASDDIVLRDILYDLEHVEQTDWAEHHLPPKFHFLGDRTTMTDPPRSPLRLISSKVQRTLFSLSAIYPNVMHFYAHLQLQYTMERDGDVERLDEMAALSKIQSLIDMRVCNLQVAGEMMEALRTLHQCRCDRDACENVDDAELFKLLSECITRGQLTPNKSRVDFSIYPTASFKEESTASRLTCLERWRYILPWIWSDVGFRHGVTLVPNAVDAAFLSTFKPLSSVTIECSHIANDKSFLSALQRNQSLHSVFVLYDSTVQQTDCMRSILSVMDHLPVCTRRLYVFLQLEQDCNAAFMAHVPASITRLEINANVHCEGLYLTTITPSVWWPSLLRHVPSSIKSLHINISISMCEIILIHIARWRNQLCGDGHEDDNSGDAHRHRRVIPQITVEIDSSDGFTHSIFSVVMPALAVMTYSAAIVAAVFPFTSLLQSIATIAVFTMFFLGFLFYRHCSI